MLTRIMRVCIVILLGGISFHTNNDARGEKLLNTLVVVSDVADKKPLKQVLGELEARYGIKFTYDRLIVENKQLSYNQSNFQNLEKALDYVMKTLHIEYENIDKNLYLLTQPKRKRSVETPTIPLPQVSAGNGFAVTPVVQNGLFSTTQPPLTTVKGKVVNKADGTALPGVNIMVKNSSVGTTTDLDGSFTLEYRENNPILISSYVGFETQEVAVDNRSHIGIELSESVKTLQEAVVTALGITRDKRSLGYAVSSIGRRDLTYTPQPTILSALAAKIPGVQISQMFGGVGSSITVVIRGYSSLNNDNQPLFVIDGVPVRNQLNNNFAGADIGNEISDININDIENITVLKGASAAALYGSRAGRGVVLITTKTGKEQTNGIGVSLNSSLAFDVPLQYIEVQNKFGSGKSGAHVLEELDNESWGAQLDAGEMWEQWYSDGQKVPLVSYPNRFKDFFQTGITSTNDISVQGSHNKGHYRLSIGNLINKGVIPNTDFNRISFALNTTYALSSKLKVNTTINVTNSSSHNRPVIDQTRNDPVRSIYEMGAQVDINMLKDYWLSGQEGLKQLKYKEKQNNPYYLVHENTTGFLRDHNTAKIQVDYDISKRFALVGRFTRDLSAEKLASKKAYDNFEYPRGAYHIMDKHWREQNLDLILTYKSKGNKDWSLNAMSGLNALSQNSSGLSTNAGALLTPNLYTVSNGVPGTVTYTSEWSQRKVYGVYGSASIGFKDLVYLDLTARNDWASTLPKGNNSYFYPSTLMSVILSDIIRMPSWVDFAKIRGGVAQVGNDVAPYSLEPTYSTASDWGDVKRMYLDGVLKNSQLKPEIETSKEVGLELKFLKNRVAINATYYEKVNKNQILRVNTPIESGASSKLINAGIIANKGAEVDIYTTPILKNELEWGMGFSLTHNRTYLNELTDNLYNFSEYNGLIIRTYNGGRYGDMYQRPILRVEDKESPYYKYPILTEGGLYQTDNQSGSIEKIGNFTHKLLVGIQPTLRYKNISLYANIDARLGGDFYSNSMMFLGNNGQLESTLSGVDYDSSRPLPDQIKENPDKYLGNWIGGRNAEYGGFAWPEGSVESSFRVQDASLNPGVIAYKDANGNTFYKENLGGEGSIWLDPYTAHRYSTRPFPSQNLYSATYIKLREVAITFTLPARLIKPLYLQKASLGIVGNNLFMWTKAGIKGLDPERAYQYLRGGIFQGMEYYNIQPYTGSIGVKLSVDF